MYQSAFQGTRTYYAYRALCQGQGVTLGEKLPRRRQKLQYDCSIAMKERGSKWETIACEEQLVCLIGAYTADEFEQHLRTIDAQPGLSFVEKLRHSLVEGIDCLNATLLRTMIKYEGCPVYEHPIRQKLCLAV